MGRRLALLVATYQYQDNGLRQLTAPAHDAEALAAVLRDPAIAGFEVTTLVNEPHYVVGQAIGDFYHDRRRDDLTLLYFTGHGLKDDTGELYLAMTDTLRDNLLFTGLSAERIDRAIENCVSRQKVLILDCCYSGAFPAGRLAKGDSAVHAVERFQGNGRTVLTASDATQYSFEGDQPHGEAAQSVFTRHLVAGLRNGSADLDGDGDITIDELYSYVYERVVEEMPQQRPKKQDNVEGRTIIASNVNWTLPVYLRNALASPIATDRLSALDGLAHLHRIGNEMVRTTAEAEIRRLAEDDSKLVSTAAAARLQPDESPKVAPPPPAQPVRVPVHRPPVAAAAPTPVPRHSKKKYLAGIIVVAVVALTIVTWTFISATKDTLSSSNADPTVLTRFEESADKIRFSADGTRLAAVSGLRAQANETVKIFDITEQNASQIASLGPFQDVIDVAFNPADSAKVALVRGEDVALMDTGDPDAAKVIAKHRGSVSIAFSPDGKLLATAGTLASESAYDNPVSLWDSSTGTSVATAKGPQNGVQSMQFSPDNGTLVAGAAGDPQTVFLWDMPGAKPRATPTAGMYVLVSPDNKTLATSTGKDHAGGLWNLHDAGTIRTLPEGVPVGFSPDSKFLAIVNLGRDRTVEVVDTTSRTATTSLEDAYPVAFSPDGRKLATGSRDNTVRLLDTSTGRTITSLSGNATQVNDLAFSPDGNRIASAGGDKTVRLWPVPS